MAVQAEQHDLVEGASLEDKLVDLWPDYPCLYDVRSADFRNRDKRESAFEEIAEKLSQSGDVIIGICYLYIQQGIAF